MEPYVHKAQYYETDGMGIIHHSNYIRWFEEARVDFLDKIGFGYEKVAALGIDFPLYEVSCQYKSMVRFGETVVIRANITELSQAKMTISYVIADAATGELRTIGSTCHYVYRMSRGRIVSLKKEIPELYERMAGFVVK